MQYFATITGFISDYIVQFSEMAKTSGATSRVDQGKQNAEYLFIQLIT